MILATLCWAASVSFAASQIPASTADKAFRVALSVSPFTEMLLAGGAVFTDGKSSARTTQELQRLFMNNGSNEVYARISTTHTFAPGDGDHSVNRGLERARMAKALGLPFNPEIGLWKSYGDVTHQPPPDFRDYPAIKLPGEWTSLTLDQMLPALHAYGELVAREIISTGVRVRIWDLGNEVDFGVAGVAVNPTGLWQGASEYKPPDAVDPEIGKMTGAALLRMGESQRIAWLKAHIWPRLGKMLSAVATGIRAADPGARFSTHVSGVFAVLPASAVAFFQTLRLNGYTPDECGFSFYPTSSPDSLKRFKQAVAAVHRELERPVFIAEYAYPSGHMTGPFSWNIAETNYPQTPEGQAAYTRDLVAWARGTGFVSGIRYWAPDFAAPGWAPMALFQREDGVLTARPALSALGAK